MDVSMPLAHVAPAGKQRPGRAGHADERLACAVASGDRDAFTAIFERYHQPLYRYCRSILRDDHDAQDALQTAMVGAFVALQNGRRDAPLRPWLFRIAHNASISAMRRRRPGVGLAEGDGPALATVEGRVEERRRLALLVADLAELPERQRGALVMRELSGLSHEEIARALGISVGAAKQSIFEARRSLAEFAEGREIPCEGVQRAISDRDGRILRSRRARAHLRECRACVAFAEAIEPRRAALSLLAPPLAPLAASSVLARLGGGHGGGALAGAGVKSTALALAAKAATVAVLAGAALLVTHSIRLSPAPPSVPRRHVPAAAPAVHPSAASATPPAAAGGVAARTRLPAIKGTAVGARSAATAAASAPSTAAVGGAPAAASGLPTVHWTAPAAPPQRSAAVHAKGAEAHASHNSTTAHGKSAAAHASHSSTTAHGKSAVAHASHSSTTAHGKSAAAHAKHATTTTTAVTSAATSATHGNAATAHAKHATTTTTTVTSAATTSASNGNSANAHSGNGSTPAAGATGASGAAPSSPPGRHTS